MIMSNKTALVIVGILFVIIIILVFVLLQPSQIANINDSKLKTPLSRNQNTLDANPEKNENSLRNDSDDVSSDAQGIRGEPTVTKNINSAIEIDMKKTYQAVIKTSEGEITVKLNAKETPITVNNFVKLSKKGFYKNTIFHRVIKGFMIQGGDPKRDGTGGPGYKFEDEPFNGEYTRGTIAMANAGPNTNGSQFFIMHKDYDLPKNYVIFGQVVKGIEVVDKIAEAPVEQSGEGSKPINPVKVLSVSIIEQ